MSEQPVASEQELGSRDSDPADLGFVANFQQSANLAERDPARTLADELSAQLREAQDRINQLEREADGLGEQLLAEAKAIIQEVQSSADARVKRTIREADEHMHSLKAEAESQIGRLQNDLAQATRAIDEAKAEADKRIESVNMQTDARVASVEADAKKLIDVIRRENEGNVLRLEAELRAANKRSEVAEQCITRMRSAIEQHVMPIMRDAPNPVAGPRSSRVPTASRALASKWFRRLWLRVSTTRAALGYGKTAIRQLTEQQTLGL